MKNRIGEVNYNKFGSKMEIVTYKNAKDIDVYFEEYNWIKYNSTYNNFIKGSISCPYEPKIYNVGYFGEGKYICKVGKTNTKCYDTWNSMLGRCYSEKFHLKNPSYIDCKVDEKWFNFQNYGIWFDENYYKCKNEEMCLDKDILYKGNKIYSSETCIFVPKRINSLFVKSDIARGNYPIGVSYNKRDDILEVWCNNSRKRVYLGRFKPNQVEEAFQCYKQFKEKIIKQTADEYKDLIPKKLYDAMYRYEVEITD